ncbi:hypothetical protein BN137_3394 [Cronobacter condimenti 1330]|uniref:Uncharacterized protein n=1 Tax=Cronobacter condimenti 1330 TaxID=1073999 RepID=K8A2Q6_9ENTR|nr:hypothetical protein BN137_3394 [Cronobacter condimenti 1330]
MIDKPKAIGEDTGCRFAYRHDRFRVPPPCGALCETRFYPLHVKHSALT